MIQAMRKDEEDQLDEEAEIMREMEMEEAGISVPAKPKASEFLVEDSQAPMPLGPDRGLESDDKEEDEPATWHDGKPRKPWKKKGLKRQTRRVNSALDFLRSTSLANSYQCGQISRNQSLKPRYKYKTIQKMMQMGCRRHR